MGRRIISRLMAVVCSAIAACQVSAAEDDPALYGRAVAFAQPNSPWELQWRKFKARVAEDPSIQIDYFTHGERGGEEQMLHDLRRGRAHIGGFSSQGLASTIPELTIPMIPFLFDSAAQLDFVYDEYLLEIFNDIAAEKGLVFLLWGEVGWTNIYSNVPILTPKDARGRKLRGSPNVAAQYFLHAIGADVVPLGSTDLVPALQTGLIDGGLTSTVFHYYVTQKYADHFTLTRHSYDTGAILVNRAWFESATPSQRKTIRAAFGTSAQARAMVRDVAANALEAMRGDKGMQVHDLTPAQRALWIEATKGIDERLIAAVGGRAREVFKAIKEGKQEFRARAGGPANPPPRPDRP